MTATHEIFLAVRGETHVAIDRLKSWKSGQDKRNYDRYNSLLYSEGKDSALKVPEIKPIYSESSPTIPGFELLNKCFDSLMERDPRVLAFGEDVGQLGDVNQAFAGLQAKYGEVRIFDTGIREATIRLGTKGFTSDCRNSIFGLFAIWNTNFVR